MTSVRHNAWLAVGLVACVGIAQPDFLRAGDLPTNGMYIPELDVFDQTMQDFMATREIEAGLLGVMKDGCIVYERGFGWQNASHTVVLPEDAMMRIASCTKPITAAAINKLFAAGVIDPNDFVFDLGQPEGGILAYTPFPGPDPNDARLADITVQHLLDHEGGWDRMTAGPPDPNHPEGTVLDWTYKEVLIASEMGIPSPPERIDTVRYIMGQPLQVDPGTERHYSNIGYLLLGLIIEQESGMEYNYYVWQEVFGPIPGELGYDVEQGHTFTPDLNPREPWYAGGTLVQNVFDPNGLDVLWQYGGWDHEARVSQGGQIAATEVLLKFLEHYYVNGSEIGAPTGGVRLNFNHGGVLSRGTSAVIRQRADGVNFVVLFNRRDPDTDWGGDIKDEIDAVLDAGGFTWPTHCIDGVWVDFNHAPSGVGNFGDPFNTLAEGLANTPPDGRVQVKSGSTSWTGTISQCVEICAPLGLVTIGG